MDLELPARYGGESTLHWNASSAFDDDSVPACSGVAAVDALDAALENLSEFSISVRELGRYAQNLGKERTYFTLDMDDLAR